MSEFPVLFPDSALNKTDGNEIAIENGNTTINAVEYPLMALNLYGKSTQDTSSGGEAAGKNLLQITTANKTVNGVTFTVNDDKTVTANGTSEGTTWSTITVGYVALQPNVKYILSGCPVGGSYEDTYRMVIVAGDIVSRDLGEGAEIEVSENVTASVNIQVVTGYTASNLVFKPMLELGSTTTEYEPYVGTPTPDAPIPIVSVGDDGNLSVTACGKNLLASAIKETQTKNGITVEAYGDGSYRATGTATADTRIAFQLPKPIITPNELIYISTNNSVAYETNMAVSFLSNTTNIATIYLREINQKATRDKLIGQTITHIAFNFVSGVTVDVTVKPQLETKQYSEFDPYKGNTATITSGLPLCSVGEYRDELIFNADGTGKIIKRIAMITLDGSNDEEYSMGATTNVYVGINTRLPLPVNQTTEIKSNVTDKVNNKQATTDSFAIHCGRAVNLLFGIDMNVTTIEEVRSWLATHPTTIIYPLAEPQEIELSAVEMAELMKLQTFDGVTNIYNDEGAEMMVKVATNPILSEYVKPVIDGITARYETRIAALEAAVTNT